MTGIDRSIFFVFKIFGKYFFGQLDLTRDIFGYSKQSEDSWKCLCDNFRCYDRNKHKKSFSIFFRYIINYCVLEIFKAWEFGMGFFGG